MKEITHNAKRLKPDQLAAYALLTVTIHGPNGPYIVTEGYLPQGSPLVPYVYNTLRQDLLEKETKGCDVRSIFQNVKVYTRPDGEFFEINHGEPFADYEGWKYVCKDTRIGSQRWTTGYEGGSGGLNIYYADIDKLERHNTISGELVSRLCAYRTDWRQYVYRRNVRYTKISFGSSWKDSSKNWWVNRGFYLRGGSPLKQIYHYGPSCPF